MTRADCVRALDRRPIRESKTQRLGYQLFTLVAGGNTLDAFLLFDTAGGLWGIETKLYTSRDFWDEDYTDAEVESLTQKAFSVYQRAIEESVSVFGNPTYTGEYGEPGYPDEEGEWKITLWNRPIGRWLVSLDHPDRELPIAVSARWHAPYRRVREDGETVIGPP